MATLVLTKAWLNILSTGVGISFYTGKEKNHTRQMKGEVRQYAGGNQRAISAKGVGGTFGFTMSRLTRDDIDVLETWLGQVVIYRDIRSRAIYGVFFEYSITDNSNPNYYTVSVTLNQVTHTEGV